MNSRVNTTIKSIACHRVSPVSTPTPLAADQTRPRYTITVEAAPGSDPTLRLRCALKSLWRRFGLRCLSVRQVGPVGKADREAAS